MQVKINVKLFHKEPDMQCWSCNQLISHKKVKWKPRKLPIDYLMNEMKERGVSITPEIMKSLEKQIEKNPLASPNKIFGVIEYEYHGQCPECNAELTLFWRGEDSYRRTEKMGVPEGMVRGMILLKCGNCKQAYWREQQVWYSVTIQEIDKKIEYLVNICPKCKAQLNYPFEYNLQTGIIK